MDDFKLPEEVKREAVLQLRELITAIENDELIGMAWCAHPKGVASIVVGQLNAINPWMLGAVEMLASGISHAMMPHMHALEMMKGPKLRVVPTAKKPAKEKPIDLAAKRKRGDPPKRGGRQPRRT